MSHEIATVEIRREQDVVTVRQAARQLAAALGCGPQEQVRIATAVSEIARNAFQYAGGGRAAFQLDLQDAPCLLAVRITDRGPGIPHLQRVLDGQYRSPGGMGLGLLGARRLVDRFRISSETGRGTTVELAQALPARACESAGEMLASAARAVRELQSGAEDALINELREQNQALLVALQEVNARQLEVQRLNQELEETNRGVLALYAELDDRAAELKRASEMKSRFLSSVSHELRTPLTSLVNLSQLLLARTDGDLTAEQEHQISLMRRSSLGLMEIVNELLDLAAIEAGKSTLRLSDVVAADTLSALRGMFRPLMTGGGPRLVFEEVDPRLVLRTDEGKVSQVLRNFISNALKFTEAGEIRVSSWLASDDRVRFAVSDTGVGIAPEDQARIFEEFIQVEGPHQRHTRGTGLGLSVSRRIAELLGGRITLESTPGVGSTFTLVLPRICPAERGHTEPRPEQAPAPEPLSHA